MRYSMSSMCPQLWDTHHNPALVKAALQDSLNKLKVDYVDLYHFHWPVSFKVRPPFYTIRYSSR
jgi:diketogulonate reductase-like aldo/keto reductase